jgi:hypothetical protein
MQRSLESHQANPSYSSANLIATAPLCFALISISFPFFEFAASLVQRQIFSSNTIYYGITGPELQALWDAITNGYYKVIETAESS